MAGQRPKQNIAFYEPYHIRGDNTMTQQDLLAIIEEGVENGRIPAHLAAYIAAEVMGVEASATGYDERVRLDDVAD
jgi:hypothetical protein